MSQQNEYADTLTVRLPGGTFDRIDQVLKGGEIRAAFIRAAVEKELCEREASRAERR